MAGVYHRCRSRKSLCVDRTEAGLLFAMVCEDKLCGAGLYRPVRWLLGRPGQVVGQTNSVEEVALLANRVGGTHVGLASSWKCDDSSPRRKNRAQQDITLLEPNFVMSIQVTTNA